MLTKPKSAYSLTHTIIWDSLYCYREAIQRCLDRQKIYGVIGKPFSICITPMIGSPTPGPFQWDNMIDVRFRRILNDISRERAYPSAGHDPAASICCKSDRC
ncbi:hypothetical protein MSSD14B_25150 [Marinobacter salsuginis]|uniref:Uncharacterized protein n=1 Tax=Marinobacter salsuginis TaxID=418719 RepID=A0A5M3Q1A0_9GAMM|nr:hypothetical protein MSSD14B_25150 [Marinobacter salsuginis]